MIRLKKYSEENDEYDKISIHYRQRKMEEHM